MGKHKSEKRSRNIVSSDEDSDSPGSKNQRVDDLKDATDDIFLDEEDRKMLNTLSEKDREIEIYKRIEMREIMKTREQIKKKLQMTQKSESNNDEPRPSNSKKAARTTRPKSARQTSQVVDKDDEDENEVESSASSASSESSDEDAQPDGSSESEEEEEEDITLTKKTSKNKRGKAAADSNEEGNDDDDEFDTEFHRPSEVAHKQSKKKAMDVLLSKRRDKKEAEEKRKRAAVLDIDEIFGEDDGKSGSSSSSSSRSSSPTSSRASSPENKPEITTRADLLRARLSRFKLAQFAHSPFFNKMAIGCFVRIGIGQHEGRSVYRVAQIVDVVETAKVYQVENTRTNKGLKLKHGPDVRVYRLEFISNTEFTQNEFQYWFNIMKTKNIPLPTLDFVERKEKDIANAVNYQYTDADVVQLQAEETGDVQEALEIQQKIDALDTKAELLDRQRSQNLSVITWINQRNRDHMKQSFLGDKNAVVDANIVDDPFTRKSGKMKVVAGTMKNKQTIQAIDIASTSTTENSTKTTLFSQKKITTIQSALKKPVNDLFSAHDIEIDIQLKLPTVGPSRVPQVDLPPARAVTKPPGARSLTLDEYKRKRGLL